MCEPRTIDPCDELIERFNTVIARPHWHGASVQQRADLMVALSHQIVAEVATGKVKVA